MKALGIPACLLALCLIAPGTARSEEAAKEITNSIGMRLALIRAGGPFPYEEDGGVFGNRERILPRQRSGYYREYTVETPGEGDRGRSDLRINGRQHDRGPARRRRLYRHPGDHRVHHLCRLGHQRTRSNGDHLGQRDRRDLRQHVQHVRERALDVL